MVDAHQIRQLARASAYGAAGGIGALAAGAGLLVAQAEQARRTIGIRSSSPPYADGRYGNKKGSSIRLVMMGDSLATSLGADDPADTIGAQLASMVAEHGSRPVVLHTVAVVSAQSTDLADQVARAQHYRPHVAVIIIGGNDVTHLVPKSRSVTHLAAAISQLRGQGTQVVVATTPDLGTVRPIQPPLRWLIRNRGRALARAQSACTTAAGARSVPMADLLGPEFRLRPEDLFSADRFHPSTEGYRAVAQALAPAVLAALANRGSGEILPDLTETATGAAADEPDPGPGISTATQDSAGTTSPFRAQRRATAGTDRHIPNPRLGAHGPPAREMMLWRPGRPESAFA